MTATVTELELIDLTAHEFAPPCGSLSGCDKSAVWHLLKKCCGEDFLFCDEHMRIVRDYINTCDDDSVTCLNCKSKIPNIFTAVFIVTRL